VANKSIYLLDSFALLAYLNDEAGRTRVQEILTMAEGRKCRIVMCLVNLGEVLYITERERGLAMAQSVLALAERLPLELLDASRDLVLDAAHIKAQHPLSFADAFATAAAVREKAMVVTGDPEFKSVEELIKIEWLGRT
jgi:predicted nucleic acid-binding protein